MRGTGRALSLFFVFILFLLLAGCINIQLPQIIPSSEELSARNSITLSGYPDVIPADGFADGSLIATVKIHDEPAAKVPIHFRTTLGTVDPETTYTSEEGRATARIYSTTPGKALIYAVYSDGDLTSNPINITFAPAPPCGDGACEVGESADSCPSDCPK